MNKKFILPVVVAFMVLGLVVFGYLYKDQLFDLAPSDFEVSDEETLFSLKADSAFENFITEAESSFTLESKVELSESEVKDLVSFEPNIEYDVKKNKAGLIGLIPQAKAQEESSQQSTEAVYSYTIIPKVALPKGELLVASIEANRDYSWAFPIEADFQVVKTLPRKQGTYVPIDSSIEITFNEQISVDVAKYVSVEPALKYEAMIDDKTLILKHGGMKEGEIYNISLDSELFDDKDSSFEGEFAFSFETYSNAYNDRGVNFWSDYESFFPDGDIFFNIGYTEIDTEKFNEDYTASVYQYASTEEFLEEYKESKNWDWYWTSLYKNNFDVDLNLEKATKLYEVNPEIVENNFRNVLYVPNEFKKGTYALELVKNSTQEKSIVWFQVSPLAHYYTYTSESGLIWLYDFESGEFVNDAKVSLLGGGSEVDLGKTNDKGVVKYATPQYLKDRDNGEGDGLPSSYKVEWNGETYLSLMEDSYWYGFYYPQADKFWNFLSTDRYVYRPTDEINFWGIVKGREDDLKNDKVKVSLSGGGFYYYDYWGGDSLVSTNAIVSGFDTVKGSLEFEGIDPGFYTLQVEKDDEIISTSSLQIVDFETPAYQLTVTPNKDSMFAGDTVQIEVEASFFDGTPVPNLEVFYNDYIGGNYYNNEEKSLLLDENGKAIVSIQAYASTEEFSYGPNSRNVYFRTGNAEEGEISSQTEVLVFEEDVYMQLIKDVSEDNESKFELTAKLNSINLANASPDSRGYYRSEYIGDPVSGKNVTANIYGGYSQKIEDGFYYDPISKTSTQKYRYKYVEDYLTATSGLTNADGEYNFTFEPNDAHKDLYTSYYVVLSSVDNRGSAFKTKSYVSNRSYSYRGFNDDSYRLSLNTAQNEPELKIGEEFELLLEKPENDKLVSGDYLYFGYQSAIDDLEITDRSSVKKMFKKEYKPGFAYQAVVLTDTGFQDTNRVVASYDELESELKIDMRSDKDKYRPGETAVIDINVTDVAGDPVQAEVNVASVDEALFHVLPYEFEKDILSNLYVDNIDSPKSGANRNESLESANLDAGAEQGGCFLPGTKVLMSNGETRNIEDVRIGDQVLSLIDSNSGNKKIVTVQGVHSYLVDNYMVINNELEVTGEHEIFLNGKWDYAGNAKVGDTLVDSEGVMLEIESLERINQPETRVYNLNVDKTHTYFADGIYVHNAEKGGSERSDFKDVSLFDTFMTNSGGDAKVEFKLPDNLTSWRISAKAFENKSILAGQNNIKVPVSLPIFASTSISPTYLVEDKPTFEIRAYGEDLKIGEEISYKLEIESLGVLEEISTIDTRYSFSIDELAIGTHTAKFSVAQGDLADTLVKEFEVIGSYSQVSTFEEALLSEKGDIDLEVDAEGMIEIELVNAGKGKFLPKLKRGLYVVNNRLDHIAIRNFVVDVMKEQFGNDEYEKVSLNINDYYDPEENGLALLTYDGAGLELTALMSDIATEDILKAKTLSYFMKQIKAKSATPERVSVALYGMASLGENVLSEVKELSKNKDNTELGQLYLALALEQMHDIEGARSIYMLDINQKDEESEYFELVSLLRSRLGFDVDMDNLDIFDDEGSVYGIAAVMAMAEPLKDIELVDSRVSLDIGGEVEEFDLSDGYSRYRKVTKAQAEDMSVDKIDGEVVLVANYKKLGEVAPNSEDLSISKKYSVNGIVTNEFKTGDLVKVTLNIANSNYDEDEYTNYQIMDYIPSGMKPVLRNYRYRYGESCIYSGYGSKAIGKTISFTRSNYMFDSKSACAGEIAYYVRVVSAGEYRAQAPVVEAYNSDNLAKGEDMNIVIK
jgi:hypothetical protein